MEFKWLGKVFDLLDVSMGTWRNILILKYRNQKIYIKKKIHYKQDGKLDGNCMMEFEPKTRQSKYLVSRHLIYQPLLLIILISGKT